MTYGTQHIIRGGKEAKKKFFFFFLKKKKKKKEKHTNSSAVFGAASIPPGPGPSLKFSGHAYASRRRINADRAKQREGKSEK